MTFDLSDHETRYAITVRWSDDDDAWIAEVPALHPCSAHGPTRGIAVRKVEEAIAGWLMVARERKLEIPRT